MVKHQYSQVQYNDRRILSALDNALQRGVRVEIVFGPVENVAQTLGTLGIGSKPGMRFCVLPTAAPRNPMIIDGRMVTCKASLWQEPHVGKTGVVCPSEAMAWLQ